MPSASRSVPVARAGAGRSEAARRRRARGAGRARAARAARASRGRARLPALASPRAAPEVDLLLALSCLDGRELRCVEAALAAACELLLDLDPPRRELADHARAARGEDPPCPSAASPTRPRARGELVPQMRLVEVAGGEPVGAQDRLAVERPPLLVGR